jgi:hypothetical protein
MTATKKKKPCLGTILRKQGFDRTEYDRSTRYYRVRCSCCQAMVINGTACHEQGCPNRGRDGDEDY